ncbi:Galactose-binding domain-like protein [Pseudohyphozyma bogoriensis]|nr:Galactose-binding domain-like protein [Pseudohyphozyma bogoriensis]
MLAPLALLALVGSTQAHMSIWTTSMYGMNTDYPAYSPIGPDWSFDDWWFRGAPTRNSPPAAGEVTALPAGGNITLEIACNVAFSSLGVSPTDNVACPGNNGAYHAGDPAGDVDYSLLAGCALAIADVDDISLVTVDNLAVFSVQKECVWQKDTVFQVPARMPPCTGSHCICAWLWEPKNGTGNYYQTPFNCDVTGSPVDATPISMPLKDPVFCPDSTADCTTGAKRPLYYYNSDYWNVEWVDNYHRPEYSQDWSWTDGPQNDIFMTAAEAAAYVRPTYTLNTTSTYVYPLGTDLAMKATAKASSYYKGQPASGAIDGKIGGYVDNSDDGDALDAEEWSSNGEGAGAWLKLTWPSAVTINQVVLYDRPNWEDHCTAGKLTFADGSVVIHGNLDNGGAATPVAIANKTTTTLLWTCTAVSAFTANIGLSEIQVYGPGALTNTTSAANSTTAAVANSTAPAVVATSANSTSTSVAKTSTSTTSKKATAPTSNSKNDKNAKDGKHKRDVDSIPTPTPLCALSTPTTVTYTTKVCAGRVCTNVATSSVVSATPCATPTALAELHVEVMGADAGLPFLDNLPFEEGFDFQERSLATEEMEKRAEEAGQRRERMMSRSMSARF